MASDEKLTTITEIKAARPGGVAESAESQLVSRENLISVIGNAIEFARLSQRFVGLLMVQLARPDKLEAIVGVPSAELMKSALRRLPGALRAVDRLAPATEDKLVVLLPNLKSPSQASLAAIKIQRVLEDGLPMDHAAVTVRPVVGIATFPDNGGLAEELLVHADIAVGMAITRDVSQYVFDNDNRRDADVYLGLDAPLREAIRTSQLQLHFQPRMDLQSGKCTAVEALIKWDAPDYGPVDASTIIRIAETSGFIGALTNWQINAVFRQQAEWIKRGIDIPLSVNLSALNLTDAEFPDLVQQAAGTWQIDCTRITFAMAESAAVVDGEKSAAVMQQLRSLGIKLAVTDFGSGHSSLSHVKNFPLDELKIGKLFTHNLRESTADQKTVRAIIGLARDFNLKVVAEGVDDEPTLRELKKLGCDAAQGNAFSPALTSVQFVVWLGARR